MHASRGVAGFVLKVVVCALAILSLTLGVAEASPSTTKSPAKTKKKRITAAKQTKKARNSRKPAKKQAAANTKRRNNVAKKTSPPAPAPQKPALVLDDPAYPLDENGRMLARAMADLWTRDAGRLVSVVAEAHAERHVDAPLTLLLAIAHAETNGRVLLVSEAGAVGLAQATPIAYLAEGGKGKLFVTDDYAVGAWAYILKKPLNDADRIATLLIDSPSEVNLRASRDLLHAAFAYREVGIEELRVLSPFVKGQLEERIEKSKRENLETLFELQALLDARASRNELVEFRDRTRNRYRAMRDLQRRSWSAYQTALVQKRDELIERDFGADAGPVIKTRAYDVAEMLARELDERFSPHSMARFLRDHVQTKIDEARSLGVPPFDVERVSAGLYNGGAHNIKRMMAGLIPHLPETEKYMKKVPATRRRLDAALAGRHEETTSMAAAGR